MDGKSDYFQGKFSVLQNIKFKRFSKMTRLLKPFFLSLNYKCNWENIAEFNKIICIFWSRSFNSFPLVRRKQTNVASGLSEQPNRLQEESLGASECYDYKPLTLTKINMTILYSDYYFLSCFSFQAQLWWLSTLFYWLCITSLHLQQAADTFQQHFGPHLIPLPRWQDFILTGLWLNAYA